MFCNIGKINGFTVRNIGKQLIHGESVSRRGAGEGTAGAIPYHGLGDTLAPCSRQPSWPPTPASHRRPARAPDSHTPTLHSGLPELASLS
ncbi:hypothetical protein E2C01_102668 [Portunus trituberculatus]|uniref:Uncharacterized protein n=1 Tax=Portunus trituberculatus TaxID=210409 RepID=A0A5B7KN42_PORTR|nr:hypothetical protein [Portunus trituberculatus]